MWLQQQSGPNKIVLFRSFRRLLFLILHADTFHSLNSFAFCAELCQCRGRTDDRFWPLRVLHIGLSSILGPVDLASAAIWARDMYSQCMAIMLLRASRIPRCSCWYNGLRRADTCTGQRRETLAAIEGLPWADDRFHSTQVA